MKTLSQLIKKYDVQAPRYTSYPTVPHWQTLPTTEQWIGCARQGLAANDAKWSLYLHIPFCETLCTFCGCNTSITKNKKVGSPYVEKLLIEWSLYQQMIPELKMRELQNLHLGGGTPTFLSATELKQLLTPILSEIKRAKNFEASIEVDPRRTNREQLVALRELGFQRISLGVQDLDPNVQRLINRHQTLEQTLSISQMARDLGYESVNWDLIYGLPQQTEQSIANTLKETLKFKPDRIALYSFALVPWIKPQQRLFSDADLPQGNEKRQLYEQARQLLIEDGYIEVGMDHFARPNDKLSQAIDTKKLHRNFMGYTDQRTEVLLGLGVSAISEAPNCFHQNEKILNQYEARLDKRELPTHRGHLLTTQEQKTREQILTLMTLWEVEISAEQKNANPEVITTLISDQLIEIEGSRLKVTELGRPFLRNICMILDPKIAKSALFTSSETQMQKTFSKSI